ncbi:DUF5134 domain-containing protein [Streptomyces sp. XD-27]|uniref:DUF5134 domain-containing protein n=1 Tax=Streptomyces sp. XD-27 TaxID=3062779 RepID=UPI0026F44C33|nr:DUF5134 domain-containing protein [Streptomyces sp. XD-27]WKX73605.1 DUF5134 domain-containing protein [Streptomyces sp. XD-27]
MHGPPFVGWLLVALGAATGAYCLLRLRAAPPNLRQSAGAEALMAWGMAVMAVPAVPAVPAAALGQHAWAPPAFVAVFGAAAVHALLPLPNRWGGRPPSHRMHHAVEACAMVYMAVAMAAGGTSGPGGHADHTGGPAEGMRGGEPLLTGALLAYFAAYVIRGGARLVSVADTDLPRGAGHVAWSQRPEVLDACRVAMGTGMCAMLLTL